MTAKDASFIMMSLKDVLENIEAKNPSEKRAGMVLIPKINITTAPQNTLAVLAAVTAKK